MIKKPPINLENHNEDDKPRLFAYKFNTMTILYMYGECLLVNIYYLQVIVDNTYVIGIFYKLASTEQNLTIIIYIFI